MRREIRSVTAKKAEDCQKELRFERQRPEPEPEMIRTPRVESRCMPILHLAKTPRTEEPNDDYPSSIENPIGSVRESRESSHDMAQDASGENPQHRAHVHPAGSPVQERATTVRAGVTFVSLRPTFR
jgi:hypothetical protein